MSAVSATETPHASAPSPSLSQLRAGAAQDKLVQFVARVSNPSSPDRVPPGDRIAVFDNDGTLWSEQPLYFEFLFAVDRVIELLGATPAPAWSKQPWAARLKKDGPAALATLDQKALLEIFAVANAGLDEASFRVVAQAWLSRAKHPRFNRPFTDLTYAPMVQLLDYLRAHDFKIFIVSGGSLRFIRIFAQRAYGIPPERVVGSYLDARYELKEGQGAVVSAPSLGFLNDGPGKPVGIERAIGGVPILAVGNSDGDREMLEYVTSHPGPRLGVLVHHDDAEREWAYDRSSQIGRLDKALDQAATAGWVVLSMKDDFASVYAGTVSNNALTSQNDASAAPTSSPPLSPPPP
jgi:phosphoglycolate phosphatase-like HAD superfamily hydrolase